MSKTDESFSGELKKETAEVLQPGKWYWIVGGELNSPSTEYPMRFWVNEIPTEPGSLPPDHQSGMCYVVDYQSVHDGWLNYGDKVVSYGGVKAGKETLPGYVTGDSSNWFLLWAGTEFSDEW
jgi:hypothetical protein